MFSLRAKLIFFMGMLTIFIGILSCLFFLFHSKRQQEEALKKLGTSLVTQLAQDSEVKHALNYTQSAFLDAPIKRVQALDMEDEIGYCRISNVKAIIIEEKAAWLNIQMQAIPARYDYQNHDAQLTHRKITSSGETFYDFSVPVVEKQTFPEEAFAAQLLGEAPAKTEQKILGFVQIGLSPHKLNERIRGIVLRSILPMGLFILLGGIGMTFFFTKYFVSPIRHMADITLDIARGNLTRMVDIRSRDEIGQLSTNFNEMTRALKTSYDEKEKIMKQLRENIISLSRANVELVRINEQLNDAQERLVRSEKLAVVGKLASGVGHELRNPLGAIRNALYIIKKKAGNSGAPNDIQMSGQLLEIIERETDRSIKIVNDLLGFSRTAKPTVSPTNVRFIIESALSRLRIPDTISTVIQVGDNLPLIPVDANQIEQVFINLIQNALDVMPNGGQLSIHGHRESNFLVVTITDTGCGIPDAVKDKLFDPLFTTKPKGIGLGLAISSNIVQRHDGVIDVESKEGEGANFIVRLPITKT